MAIVTKTELENMLIRVSKKKINRTVYNLIKVRKKMNRTVYNFSKDFKNLIVQDANGLEIDFFKLKFDEIPQDGDEALIDNKKAKGEYTMPDGNIWTFVDGKLKEIKVKDSSLENKIVNKIDNFRTVYKK